MNDNEIKDTEEAVKDQAENAAGNAADGKDETDWKLKAHGTNTRRPR